MKRSFFITYLIGCFLQWGYLVNRPELTGCHPGTRSEALAPVAAGFSALFWPIYWPAQFAKYLTRP